MLVAGTSAQSTPAPETLDGKTFAGVRFELPPTLGRVAFRGTRAWTWAEGATRRVVIEGDVRVELGGSAFAATRAVGWLEPIGARDGGGALWQVFVVLEGVRTPTGEATLRLASDRLPVRAVIELAGSGGVELVADRRIDGPPRDGSAAHAVAMGERTLADRLRRQIMPLPPRGATESPDALLRRGEEVPGIDGQEPERAEDLSGLQMAEDALGVEAAPEPIFAKEGVFTFSAQTIELQSGAEQNALTLAGGVAIQYSDIGSDRRLQLSAERAVVFLEPGALSEMGQGLGSAGGDRVRGVYLEGDVQASDGRYSLRSPRVYYDVRANRAMLVDAVFWTFDERRGLPLYVRARTIAQESADQFRAERARVTNTAFFEPDLAIGASTITVTRRDSGRGEGGAPDPRLYVDARDLTLRVRDVPVFYWPVLRGEADQPPLKDVRVENSGGGPAVKTTWNLLSLLGVDRRGAKQELSSELLLDWHFERNLGLGTNTRWSTPTSGGELLAYVLPDDTGKDILPTGVRQDRDGGFRGLLLFEHRARLAERWTLSAELASISDPTLVDSLFRPMATQRREFTNAVTVQRIEDNSVLTARVSGSFDDFIANQDLLQTPGYRVARAPDIGYARFADDLLPRWPGALTWSSEYRYSGVRQQFDRVRPIDRGYDTPSRSQSAFGTLPGESIAEALKRQGYSGGWVQRFDTRQELSSPLTAGPVMVTPWVVGRLTSYDDDFSEFAALAGGRGREPIRAWGSVGLTIATEFQRVFNEASSRLLDINRLRHIVRPSVTAFSAASNRDASTLPVFDREVESLQTGTATRLAVNQVLQSQRGGPGRWRSVDVATWDTELVLPSGDTGRDSPIGQWIEARPEESVLGDAFLRSDATWQLSEVVGLGGGVNYDFGTSQLARSNAAITMNHQGVASSYVEMRSIGSQDQTLLSGGVSYRLSPTYTVSGDVSYDTRLGEIQTVSTELRRQFPNAVFGVGISYDNIRSTTSFGFVLQPLGIGGGRVSGLGGGTRGFRAE